MYLFCAKTWPFYPVIENHLYYATNHSGWPCLLVKYERLIFGNVLQNVNKMDKDFKEFVLKKLVKLSKLSFFSEIC